MHQTPVLSLAGPPPADPRERVAKAALWLDTLLVSLLALVERYWRVLGPLKSPLYNRISRIRVRLARLLANLQEGRTPRPSPPRKSPAVPRTRPPHVYFPRRYQWVAITLEHNARAFANHLRILLHDAERLAAIAVSPGVRRTLRPLCHMLGVELPEALRLPPRAKKPKPPRTPKPKPEPFPPGREIPAYVLAAARAWKRRTQKSG